MSPASWMRVRGFVELPTYGFFDAMLLHQARRHGIAHALVAYPALVVHENHGDGGFAKRANVVGQLSVQWRRASHRTHISLFFSLPFWQYPPTDYWPFLGPNGRDNPNTAHWGHAAERFPETVWEYGQRVSSPAAPSAPAPSDS